MLWRMRGYQPHANLLFLVALASAPGANALEANKRIDVDFEVGVVSDYRFRGLTLTGKDPALQAGLTVSLANGAYSNIWASTIDEYGAGPDGKGAIFEMDFTLGWAGRVGDYDLDASVQRYTYPGGDDVAYIEMPVTVSRDIGNANWTLGVAYAPSQAALGHQDNRYGWAAVSWTRDDVPLMLDLSLGYEDGAYAPGGKWDWAVGMSRQFGTMRASVSYVDSDRSSAGVVAALTSAF